MAAGVHGESRRVTREDLDALRILVTDGGRSLTDAFDARLLALLPALRVSDARVRLPRNLFEDLAAALAAAPDFDRLLDHAIAVAGRRPVVVMDTMPSIGIYGVATQALDWALRDVMLERYSTSQRAGFSEVTTLFVELLRRLGPVPGTKVPR